MLKYPQLAEQVNLYHSWRLARARKKLLGVLKEIFCTRFQSLCCIWKTNEGRLVMCLGRQFPQRSDLPVAPIVDVLSPSICHSSRLKASQRYLPYFQLQVDKKICYVDLKKSFLLPVSHLQEYVDRLPAGSRELAALELARQKTGYDFLSWMNA